jgi:hypothetical protein
MQAKVPAQAPHPNPPPDGGRGDFINPPSDGGRGDQQKDNLCGAFWGARVLRDHGFVTWDGEEIDEDLIALRAGTVLPERSPVPSVPRGAVSRTGYRYRLPIGPEALSGTAAPALQRAIEAASGGALRCVPIRGSWTGERVQGLMKGVRDLPERPRLIANVRTGCLWGSRPSPQILIDELDGHEASGPAADWDAGHFVELAALLSGAGGSLVVVRDSYPTLGWQGHHLQPPRVIAAALERGDGREGGVLAIGRAAHAAAVESLASELGLEIGTWDNGTA